MSVRRIMRMRVTVQRRAAGTDAYGHPNGAWVDQPVLPCYAYTDAPSRKANVDDGVTAQLSVRVWVPSGSDVLGTDRILKIEDRLESERYGRLDIDGVNPRVGYVELVCRRAQ